MKNKTDLQNVRRRPRGFDAEAVHFVGDILARRERRDSLAA